MNLEERKRFTKLNAAWRAGEKIDALQFRYNSMVKATLSDGVILTGWIVGANIEDPEPIYAIEAQDGSGDAECPETSIQKIEK